MPEEDDDALGQMLGDRIKGAKGDSESEEGDDTDETNASDSTSASDRDTDESSSRDNTESAQIAQSTGTTSTEAEGDSNSETGSGSKEGSVRSRSPFPLYVTPELKETVQDRFEKFNAQRTLDDKPQVEKHKHFMEGLLRAGLDHPDLEEYVLDEFSDD